MCSGWLLQARNFTQCDSLLIGDRCGAHTVPYVENRRADAQLEHEATTTKLSDDQMFYVRQCGVGEEEAVAAAVADAPHHQVDVGITISD